MRRFGARSYPVLVSGWLLLLVGLATLAAVAQEATPPAGASSAKPAYAMLVIGIIAGLLFRTFVPFLRQVIQEPGTKWEWKYLLPVILGGVITAPAVLMGLPALLQSHSSNGLLDFVAAFSMAYTIQDITREGQKAATGGSGPGRAEEPASADVGGSH